MALVTAFCRLTMTGAEELVLQKTGERRLVVDCGWKVAHRSKEFIQSILDVADYPGTSVSGPDLHC
jgi:hypothetical protein